MSLIGAMFIFIPSRYAAQSSTASDDDLLHITHAGSVIEQTADRLEIHKSNYLPHLNWTGNIGEKFEFNSQVVTYLVYTYQCRGLVHGLRSNPEKQ